MAEIPVILMSISLVILVISLPAVFFPQLHRSSVSSSARPYPISKFSHGPPSLQYESDWFSRRVFLPPIDVSKCRLCTYPSRSSIRSDSTPRDAILTFAASEFVGLIPFVRSVRTTGCKARLIVLAGDQAIAGLAKREQRLLKQCSADLISFGDLGPLWLEQEVLVRFSVYFDYLFSRQRDFNRVLFVDMAHVMFQGDPFTADITRDALCFVQEGITLENATPERNNFLRLRPRPPLYKGKPLITDHIFGGGPESALVFFDMFLTVYSMTYDENELASEHSYFLLCYYSFCTSSHRLKTKLLGPNNGIVGLAYYINEKAKESPGYYKTKDAIYAAVVNHFQKNHQFRYDYYDACPRGRFKAARYMGGILGGYMNKTMDRFGRRLSDEDADEGDDN
jgi:hypothetical protein